MCAVYHFLTIFISFYFRFILFLYYGITAVLLSIRMGPCAEIVSSNLTRLSGASLTWVNEICYLGVYVVKSRVFKCSLEVAKRSFYRAANAI